MIRYFENADLTGRNSFRVSQRAACIAEFDCTGDLPQLFGECGTREWRVLGGGNNILFTRDFEGMLVVPCGRAMQVVRDEGDDIWLRVEAGAEWDDIVQHCVDNGWWGAENLSLIPGKAGAAPVQNIGAYGVEVKDIISEVEMYVPASGNFVTLAAQHCDFGYRSSVFKTTLRNKVVITAVVLRLSRRPDPRLGYGDLIREVEARGGASLRNIREAVCAIRRSKLPDTSVLGNAGSFFKNPVVPVAVAEALRQQWPDMPLYPVMDKPDSVKLAAGWLIDRAGLKGYRQGCVGVHERQALVLVNFGGAAGHDILALADTVRKCVGDKFGVDIEPEVNIF